MRIARTANSGHRIILGVDASLTSTGYSYLDSGVLHTGCIPIKNLSGAARLFHVRSELQKIISYLNPSLVVYEDYAMAGNGRVFSIGELGGVLRLCIWEQGIDLMSVPPSTLKKLIAGHGQAAKDATDAQRKVQNAKKKNPKKKNLTPVPNMRDAINQIFGFDIEQNDEADGFALMMLGEIRFNRAPRPVTLDSELLHSCPVIKGKKKKNV